MKNISDLSFLDFFTATMLIELFFLFLFRFTNSPFAGKEINRWYSDLKWTAVTLDILSVMIGFYLAKYLYKFLIYLNIFKEESKITMKTLSIFLLCTLFVQITHDILFYYLAIKPTRFGSSKIMDSFKTYADDVKFGAVIGDSSMYILSMPVLFLITKYSTTDLNLLMSLISLYTIGFFIHEKPRYVNIK